MRGPPRRRPRRRVRGAELHAPHRRDRPAAVGVLQPGRLEHASTTTERRTGPIRPALRVDAGRRRGQRRRYAGGGGASSIGSIDTGVDFGHPEFTGRLIAGQGLVSATTTTVRRRTTATAPTRPARWPARRRRRGRARGGVARAGATCSACAAGRLPDVGDRQRDPRGGRPSRSQHGRDEPQPRRRLESQAEKSAIAYATSKTCSSSRRRATRAEHGRRAPRATRTRSRWPRRLAGRAARLLADGLGARSLARRAATATPTRREEGCVYSSVGSGLSGRHDLRAARRQYAYMQGTSMAAPQVTGTRGRSSRRRPACAAARCVAR